VVSDSGSDASDAPLTGGMASSGGSHMRRSQSPRKSALARCSVPIPVNASASAEIYPAESQTQTLVPASAPPPLQRGLTQRLAQHVSLSPWKQYQ